MFYPSSVLSKSPGFSKILTIYFDKVVTKTQKKFFMHRSILKQKNWRKQNQSGIKFKNIECVIFIFGTFLPTHNTKCPFHPCTSVLALCRPILPVRIFLHFSFWCSEQEFQANLDLIWGCIPWDGKYLIIAAENEIFSQL